MATTVFQPNDLPDTAEARRAAWDRVGRAGVAGVLALTLVMYLGCALLALRWARQPFMGGFVEPTLIFNDAGATGPDPWPAFAAGVRPLDQLLTVNGQPVPNSRALNQRLAQMQVGQTVTLGLARADGSRAEAVVTLAPFPARSFVTLFVVPYGVGLAYLAIGLLVLWLRRNRPAGRACALFCAAAAVGLCAIFDLYTTHAFAWAWTLAIPLSGGALMTLGLLFPHELTLVQKQPALRLAALVPAVALGLYALYTLYAPGLDPRAYIGAWRLGYGYMGAGILGFLLVLAYRRFTSPSPIAREQSQVILLGALCAFSLIFIWAVRPFFSPGPLPLNAARDLPLLALFPLAMAYALLRYRLIDTDYVVGQTLMYAALVIFGLVAYGLILVGLSLLAGAVVQADNPVALALLVIALVAAFNPLRERLQALVNDAFFRGTRAYRQRLQTFGRALTRAVALGDIYQAVDEQVQGALRPAHLYLFLRDAAGGDFAAYAENTGPRGAKSANAHTPAHTELRFAAEGALVSTLQRERAALYLTPETPLPAHLLPDRARLALLGSTLHAPLHGQTGLAGWLAVGPKLSGQPLTREDVRFVEALADQAALAVERATVISDLERRVRELNVLSQMSQAVNFTLAYDDLLELIYAQASKVVDTRNLYILLNDAAALNFSYALFVENNERENGQENKPWPMGRGLAGEIRRTGQPIRTDNYLAECRRRNVAPRSRQYTAWMGVPLNTGADTIGVMAVASFEPGFTFAEDQLKIFWAIADQAASALVRAGLFLKSEERARQLSTLNELSTSMASDLELDPLLSRIVHSSMDMLVCDAGSLFLTDTDTGEYVFRVAAGPVGQNLVGLRIARGKGFVGEAIEGGQVIIVNDVQNDPRWFKGSDQSTGFVTRTLMVVPLRRGGRTIGALEVINKRDGSPFDDEDRTLLTAFAGQAAVAIENARLFAQTDQALTERVEELSVMQRIDRELNEALDVKRVMDITLSWAMTNSRASAGSVGMVNAAGILIIATHGYGDTVEQLRDRPLPVDRGIMGRVVRTGRMSLVRDVRTDPDYRGILPATRCQLTIPIVREGIVVGLINLESPSGDAFNDDQVAFVTRLMDHASVAITNARLYSEVTAANIAKSEFVSVAAHELKTPMTAIKMAAELMLSGAVGATNDTQKQFLTTIRNNLDRMTTIVSDLNDITRIETGRLLLDIKPFDFQAVVDEVLHETRSLVEAKAQTLTLDVAPDLGPVLGDLNRASQVLSNLVSNANKYTPEQGEIVLRIQPTDDGRQLHIAVQDSGIGISEEDQRQLFTKFFRSDDRAARDMASGTGLGLSIVKNLVELQGGRIWVESEYRRGSTFHFTLPLAEAAAPATALAAAPGAN